MIYPPKDALLNELAEGQWVGLKLGDQFIVGMIKKLTLGGLDIPGQKEKTKASMLFGCEIPINFESGAVFNNIFRLQDPAAERKLMELLSQTKAGPKLV